MLNKWKQGRKQDQESIQSNTTPDPDIWESDKRSKTSYTRQPRGRLFLSTWPQAARNRQDSMTDKHETQIHVTKRIHKRSATLERSVRKLLEDSFVQLYSWFKSFLTLYLLMNCSVWFHRLNFSNKIIFISLRILIVLANSVDPDEMPHHAEFHLGLHCLPKYAFRLHHYTKR